MSNFEVGDRIRHKNYTNTWSLERVVSAIKGDRIEYYYIEKGWKSYSFETTDKIELDPAWAAKKTFQRDLEDLLNE